MKYLIEEKTPEGWVEIEMLRYKIKAEELLAIYKQANPTVSFRVRKLA